MAKTITCVMDDELVKSLDTLAEKTDRPRAYLVRKAVSTLIAQEQTNE